MKRDTAKAVPQLEGKYADNRGIDVFSVVHVFRLVIAIKFLLLA
jgi:hypothetical protein